MDKRRLAALWTAIADARLSLQDARDLETLALLAERRPYAGANHVMWQSAFPDHRPFPIARHGGKQKVGHYAQKVILNALEDDAAAWQDLIDNGVANDD